MNKQALFTQARQMTRETIARFVGGDYRATFSACLKQIYGKKVGINMNFDDRKNAMVLAFERKMNEIIVGWLEKSSKHYRKSEKTGDYEEKQRGQAAKEIAMGLNGDLQAALGRASRAQSIQELKQALEPRF